ncbi:MAG: hypothetical protein BroJett011_33300 [Chloroflexota bacterium]|nr:MAG: hypothetical protein BroJett011_33300 [Chloroflexota bacterium]
MATSKSLDLEFPQLETERLLLRELKSTDAEAVYRYLSDPEVTRYLATPTHRSLKQTQDLLNFLVSLFEKGGRFRCDYEFVQGRFRDVLLFSLLAKSYDASHLTS